MIQEIKYNGHTANPSDYECNDGDLAVSMDAVLEDGALRPILPPTEVFEKAGNFVVKYIHETSYFKHYILLYSNGSLEWRGQGGSATLRSFSTTEICQVTGIGNTLIVLAVDSMHYFLWKGETEGYVYLGAELPELPISFGLSAGCAMGEETSVDITYTLVGDRQFKLNTGPITESVLAQVNKLIASVHEQGKFIFPFFVRYALRLYDGTLTKHSAPILMLASGLEHSGVQVVTTYRGGEEGVIDFSSATPYKYRAVAATHNINYLVDSTMFSELPLWKDIVKSVDVFVSAPIYNYDQNGECSLGGFADSYSVCEAYSPSGSSTRGYRKRSLNSIWKMFYPSVTQISSTGISVPSKEEELIIADVKSCHSFYLLKSINIDELKSERTTIEIQEDYLQSIVTREVMTDDYDSHDKLVPKYSYVYNSRFNVANIKKNLFGGFEISSLFNFTNSDSENHGNVSAKIYIYIRQDNKEIVVANSGGEVGYNSPMLYFFYPNTNAYKAVVQIEDIKYEVPLKNHDFLNGAYFYGELSEFTTVDNSIELSDDCSIHLANKIYTSEVNNPFYFPVLGINTIGVGEVLGISSAAKALSEGQFGQFPLYAFTLDGVWALEVSATGTYSAKQPITRDVCINPDSITQIDSAVLFATNRGIMLISGSQTQCITDVINSPELFTLSDMPRAEDLLSVYRANGGKYIDVELIPFLEFISNCKMVYDYIHQRILVFNFNVEYGYVYSMKSKTWAMFSTNGVVDTVPAYPEAFVMKRANRRAADVPGAHIITFSSLYDYSIAQDVDVTSLIVTRPFKMGDPNMLKTIDTIIQRGFIKRENIQQILYGSNDLYNWHIVWSSNDKFLRGFRGTPYKSFRLALVCKMNKGENLYGCSVQFNPRQTNQLR